MTKGWTEERRRKQAEAIRQWKPWEKSTGPKTAEGKAVCSRNAVKNPDLHDALKEINEALRGSAAFIRHVNRFIALMELRPRLEQTIEVHKRRFEINDMHDP
jgi:hypothetical protein